MEKLEYIAEAKRRGFSDSEIQKLLDHYENFAKMGSPQEYSFSEEDSILSPDEVDYL